MTDTHTCKIEIRDVAGIWVDITEAADGWGIDMKESGAFCWDFSLSITGLDFFSICDPDIDPGVGRCKITLDGTAYLFLIEERGETVTARAFTFNISGRSLQALWGEGFSGTISDTDNTAPTCANYHYDKCYAQADCEASGGVWDAATGTCSQDPENPIAPIAPHPWQSSGVCTVQDIIDYLQASDHLPAGAPAVTWTALNYDILPGDLAVDNMTPIAIIALLAEEIGAELYPQPDGSLLVAAFSVDTEAPGAVAVYTDDDDIIQFNSATVAGGAYNAITVIGGVDIDDENTKASPYLSAERHDGSAAITPDVPHTVRVYYYSADNAGIDIYKDTDVLTEIAAGSGTKTIDETVNLQYGRGNTSKPNLSGFTEIDVPADAEKPFSDKAVSYQCRYKDYEITATEIGEYQVAFLFDDDTAMATYSFSVVAVTPPASYISAKIISETPVNINTGCIVRVYEYHTDQPPDIRWAWDVTDTGLSASAGAGGWENKTESIQLKWGAGQYSMTDQNGVKDYYNALYADDRLRTVEVTYVVLYYDFIVTPSALGAHSVTFYFFDESGEASVSFEAVDPSPAPVLRDYPIRFRERGTTEVWLPGVTVYLDGASVGTTDANGWITLVDVEVGREYAIRATKTDYQDTDTDDLINDNITIPAETP